MKIIPLLAVLLSLLVAYQKTPPSTIPVPPVSQPATTWVVDMDTTIFNNREIVFGGRNLRIDLNRDGVFDILLQCEWHADVLRLQKVFVQAYEESDLPIHPDEYIPMLAANSPIGPDIFTGYYWCTMTNVLLARKVIARDATWWEGPWNDKFNQYVPLRIRKGGKAYYGWKYHSIASRKN